MTDTTAQQAIGLYAVLAYDIGDFIEMVDEATIPVLELLYQILALPNDKHDADTVELNKLGASITRDTLELRKERQT